MICLITSQVSSQSCHLRELDLCAASLLVLTQSPSGLAINDNEIDKQCVQLKEADVCMKNFTRRCMTPIQREILTFGSNSTSQLLSDYCTKGSMLRKSYLKHSKCLNEVQKKEQKVCIKDLQNSLELLTTNNSGIENKRLQLACCTYKKFESCLGLPMEKKCGKEAINFVNGVIRRITSKLPEQLCKNYKPEGEVCRTLLPKSNIQPKGSKSNSIISRLLSAYTGLK